MSRLVSVGLAKVDSPSEILMSKNVERLADDNHRSKLLVPFSDLQSTITHLRPSENQYLTVSETIPLEEQSVQLQTAEVQSRSI